MRPWLLLLFGAASACAQPFGFGVKAGLPLTDFFTAARTQSFSFTSLPKRYVVGLDAELRLPFGLGIELDALYRRLNYTGVASATTSANVSGNGWEFPLLAKYRFPSKVVRPFVDAGFAFNTLSGLKQSVFTATGLSNAPVTTKTGKGFVMGAGLDVHVLVVHFSPEIRYTHWGSTQFVDPLSLVRGNQNQAEFLLGITF
jgi:hypothetical protein